MSAKRWLFLTLTLLLAGVICSILLAAVLDPYGIFRSARGRKLYAYDFERSAKFFLNRNYVPENYDALLIGPSSCSNWYLPVIAGHHFYNESLPGGNAAEGDLLTHEALQRGHYKVAIVVLFPTMTASHVVNQKMDASSLEEAIGSFHLYYNAAAQLLVSKGMRFHKSHAGPNGESELPYTRSLTPIKFENAYFAIDPMGAQQLQHIVKQLQDHGTRVVYLIPPASEPTLELNAANFAQWKQRILPQLPSAPLLDMNEPSYLALRSNMDNYIDVFHMEPEGAARATQMMAEWLTKVLQ